MGECLFCNIVKGEMNTEFVYEDDKIVVFKDINPQAPVHLLLVPRRHIPTLTEMKEKDYQLVGHIFKTANQLAEEFDLAEDGFRIVSNCREAGGQTVFHIHFHLLGGRNMQWPPG